MDAEGRMEMGRAARTSALGRGEERGSQGGLLERQDNKPLANQKMHTTAEPESSESGQDQAVVTSVALALTAGLSPGAKLREKQCFTLQPNGVSFHGPLTSERWQQG